MASDLDLLRLPMSHKKDARIKWVTFEQSMIKLKLDCLLSNFLLMWFIYEAIKCVALRGNERTKISRFLKMKMNLLNYMFKSNKS